LRERKNNLAREGKVKEGLALSCVFVLISGFAPVLSSLAAEGDYWFGGWRGGTCFSRIGLL
jgi:1,4-dihydroxy-2-naphthoate octaprenyltransferase